MVTSLNLRRTRQLTHLYCSACHSDVVSVISIESPLVFHSIIHSNTRTRDRRSACCFFVTFVSHNGRHVDDRRYPVPFCRKQFYLLKSIFVRMQKYFKILLGQILSVYHIIIRDTQVLILQHSEGILEACKSQFTNLPIGVMRVYSDMQDVKRAGQELIQFGNICFHT